MTPTTATRSTEPEDPAELDRVALRESLWDSLLKYIVEDLRKKSVPQNLYHYSRVEGIYGIIEQQLLHASNVEFMNDASEITFGVSEFDRVQMVSPIISRPTTGANLMTKAIFRYLIDHAERTIEAYAVCFCRQDDLLSQWRGYGSRDSMYSMKFSGSQLNRYVSPFCVLAPIAYLPVARADRIWALIRRCNEVLDAAKIRAADVTPQNVRYLASSVQSSFALTVLLMKNDAFKEEKEWRLVYSPSFLSQPERSKVLVKTRGGLAVPYVEIGAKRDKVSIDLPIRGLKVGPNQDPLTAQAGLRHLLKVFGKTGVTVDASGTPLRSVV
jgi:hypothetical protein